MLCEWGFIFCSLLHIPAACWTLKNPLHISVLFLFHFLKIVTLISWLPMTNLRLAASGHFKHSDLQWLFICHAALCWRAQWQCSSVVLGFIVNLHINSILRAIDASWDMVSICNSWAFSWTHCFYSYSSAIGLSLTFMRAMQYSRFKTVDPSQNDNCECFGEKMTCESMLKWISDGCVSRCLVVCLLWIHFKWIAIIWLLNWYFPHLRDN